MVDGFLYALWRRSLTLLRSLDNTLTFHYLWPFSLGLLLLLLLFLVTQVIGWRLTAVTNHRWGHQSSFSYVTEASIRCTHDKWCNKIFKTVKILLWGTFTAHSMHNLADSSTSFTSYSCALYMAYLPTT